MKINLNIPTSWNALNSRQLKKIAYYSQSNLSGVFFDYKVFIALLDVKWWQLYKKWKAIKTIKNVGFSTLKQHYSWFSNNLSLTTFIPTIKTKDHLLHAPANRINNLTVNEFSHADDLFIGWHNKKDYEYLHYLAAVLYRELDTNGKRVLFDKTELDQRANALKKLDKKTLLAIALSYQGSRTYLVAQFPLVFPKPKDKATTKTPTHSGFGRIVLHLSGGKFGTHNETKNTNVYTFLSEFEEQIKQKPNA